HLLLYVSDKFFVRPQSFVAQDVHVEADALLDHRLPNSTGTENADGFAGHLVAKKWQVGMPISPLVFAHQMLGAPEFASQVSEREESELGRGFGEDVGRVGEGNFVAVGVGTIDVV